MMDNDPPNADALFPYWEKCEEVAVHFNDLLIRFRVQALAALAAAGGLLGIATKLGNVEGILVAGLAFLLVLWIAIAIVDLGYYFYLLLGAVKEVKRVEALSGGAFQLSTRIERACSTLRSRVALWLFYGLPALVLLVFIIALLCSA